MHIYILYTVYTNTIHICILNATTLQMLRAEALLFAVESPKRWQAFQMRKVTLVNSSQHVSLNIQAAFLSRNLF